VSACVRVVAACEKFSSHLPHFLSGRSESLQGEQANSRRPLEVGRRARRSNPLLDGGLTRSLEALALEPNASKLFGANRKSVEGTNGRESGVGYVRFASFPPSARSDEAVETMTADCRLERMQVPHRISTLAINYNKLGAVIRHASIYTESLLLHGIMNRPWSPSPVYGSIRRFFTGTRPTVIIYNCQRLCSTTRDDKLITQHGNADERATNCGRGRQA